MSEDPTTTPSETSTPPETSEGTPPPESGSPESPPEGGEQTPEAVEWDGALDAPEGVEDLDQELLSDWGAFAKESGLTREKAQEMVAKYAERITAARDAYASKQNEIVQEEVNRWNEQLTAQHGAQLDAVTANAKWLAETYGDQEVLDLMETSIGSHPGVINMMNNVAKLLRDDNGVGRQTEPPKPQDKSQVLKAHFFRNSA